MRAQQPTARPLPPKAFPLTARALAWIGSIPKHLSVSALRREAPELLDGLAQNWCSHASLDRMLDNCLYQNGGTALPLSLAVLSELAELRSYAKQHAGWGSSPREPSSRAWDPRSARSLSFG
jgi:hypothetical protein